MLIEIFLAVLIGLVAGTITGLIPGIHINLVSVLVITYSAFLLGFFSPLSVAVFIMAMSVIHTFLDAIPSIFLGAPDADQALGVLPGHKLLLRGYGYGAVRLTIIGSFLGLAISIILFPILIKVVGFIYPLIRDLIGWFLILVVTFMIFREKKKIAALYLFFFSGVLGLIVLNTPTINNPLFPLLSGFFGVSALILSLYDKVRIPSQNFKKLKIRKSVLARSIGASSFAGILTSFLPGLGPAQGAVVAQQISGKDLGDKGFLVLIGGLNTVNMVLSLVTLYVLDKARNGSVIAVSKLIVLEKTSLVILLVSIIVTGVIGFFWGLSLTKLFSRIVEKINYQFLATSIVVLITIISIILSGPVGLIILLTSASAGLFAPLIGVSRSHAMGCLMLPVITYFVF
ncbi:hypothetical protein GOV05_00780 [Candidatus Woesearchaeota archaeon]|nr:hypothetical protein [Candidatus Woesearchaeota archaeon]